MEKCNNCNRSYKHKVCEYCTREKRWNSDKVLNQFTPRVQKELNEFDIQVAQTHIKQLQKNKSLLFTSNAGEGKTLYACQLLHDVLKLNYIEGLNKLTRTDLPGFLPNTFKFISLPNLFHSLKKDFKKETSGFNIDDFKNIHYLILDELGLENVVQKNSDWYLTNLYLLLNYRFEHLLPTIYTCNLSIDEINNLIDDRIAVRLFNQCTIINFKR